jgi:hypothetical protein
MHQGLHRCLDLQLWLAAECGGCALLHCCRLPLQEPWLLSWHHLVTLSPPSQSNTTLTCTYPTATPTSSQWTGNTGSCTVVPPPPGNCSDVVDNVPLNATGAYVYSSTYTSPYGHPVNSTATVQCSSG